MQTKTLRRWLMFAFVSAGVVWYPTRAHAQTSTDTTAVPPVDPLDNILVAYYITETWEGSFSPDDRMPSPLWDQILSDQYDAAVLTIDRNGVQRGGVPFTSFDDCRMMIKAAYGAKGLYLLAEVVDNSFINAKTSWQYDRVDLFVDNQSSKNIYSQDPAAVFFNPTSWQNTYTSVNFQVAFGADTIPSQFLYNHYDSLYWDMTFNTVDMADARQTMNGFAVDIFPADTNSKAQEWFIPWSEVGVGGTDGLPSFGTMLAFAGGYNDLDADHPEESAVNQLRWVNKLDPYAPPDSLPGWGDIFLGPSADSTTTAVTCVAPSFVSQPQSTDAAEGELVTFGVSVNATSPSYQWQRSDDSGATWLQLPSSGSTYSLTATQNLDGALFRCIVSNSCGTARSMVAHLSVSDNPSGFADDYRLIAYRLTDQEESSFSTQDKKLSPFWGTWETKMLDAADLRPATHTVERFGQFSGDDDANMRITAAWGTQGLYFLFEVEDDDWLNYVSTASDWYAYDVVDIFIDKQSSGSIWQAAPSGFVHPDYHSITMTALQLSVGFGDTQIPYLFKHSQYDPAALDIVRKDISFTQAASALGGMAFEISRLDTTTKAQEWFIPWSQVGDGGLDKTPAEGMLLAFAGGYNDRDSVDMNLRHRVRWKNRADPYTRDPLTGAPVDGWGDLQLGPYMAEVQDPAYGTVAGKVLSSGGTSEYGIWVEVLAPDGFAVAEGYTDSSGQFFFDSIPALTHMLRLDGGTYPTQYWSSIGNMAYPEQSTMFEVPADSTFWVQVYMTDNPMQNDTTWAPGDSTGTGRIAGRLSVNWPDGGMGRYIYAVPVDDGRDPCGINPYQEMSPYFSNTDATGNYTLEGLPTGEYVLLARSTTPYAIPQFYGGTIDGCQAKRILVDSYTDLQGVDFTLATGGEIKGTIVDPLGNALQGIWVRLEETSSHQTYGIRTDSSGVFGIGGIPPGEYAVYAGNDRYFMSWDPWERPVAANASQTTAAGSYTMTPSGYFAGEYATSGIGKLPDSTWGVFLDLWLYPATLPADDPVVSPEHRTDINESGVLFRSGGCPAGTWRLVFAPHPLIAGRSAGPSGGYYEHIAYAFADSALRLSTTQPLEVYPQKKTGGIVVPLRTGYSVVGTVQPETYTVMPGDSTTGLYYHIDVYVKDGDRLIQVTQSHPLGDNRFEIPGMVDGEDYYLQVHADSYPAQWYSPDGNAAWPKSPYSFSTAAFTELVVPIETSPEGGNVSDPGDTGDHWAQLWLDMNCKPGAGPDLNWGVDSRVARDINWFTIHRRSIEGTVEVVDTVAADPAKSQYTWREPDTAGALAYEYVILAAGDSLQLRSNPVHWDRGMCPVLNGGTLWADVTHDRWGIAVLWGTDNDTLRYTCENTVILYKRQADESWEQIEAQESCGSWLWDHDWDPERDSGKTFEYHVVLETATGERLQSPVVEFTLDAAFLRGLPADLEVGPYEKYKTIQAAVDAARDFDFISVRSGTYEEGVDLRGKVLHIEADWREDKPPVIDPGGGTAFTVPISDRMGDWERPRIEGFKIRNATFGVLTGAPVEISNCLFTNVGTAVATRIDSTAVVGAIKRNPFVPNHLPIDIQECTFAAHSLGRSVVSGGARGTTNDTVDFAVRQAYPDEQLSPNISIVPEFRVSNSIVKDYPSTTVYALADSAARLAVRHTVHWPSAPAMPLFDGPNYVESPGFLDTVWYFLPENSPLATRSNEGYIGYDRWRHESDDYYRNELPPVKGLEVMVFGYHKAALKWEPLSTEYTVDRYMIYRVDGSDPDLFYVASNGYWDLKLPEDSMFSVMDTFSTRETRFIDTTLSTGNPYVYVVAAVDSHGREGRIELPGTIPLSRMLVNTYPRSIGVPPGVWHMVGSIGPDTVPVPASQEWSIYHWDPTGTVDKLYSRYATPTRLVPGHGYWVWAPQGAVVPIDTASLTALASSADPVVLALDSGWNQVASPFPFAVEPSWMPDYTVYRWDRATRGYTLAPRFEPGVGYWVYSDKKASVTLKETPPRSFLDPSGSSLAKRLGDEGWQLRLSLSGDQGIDRENYIGIVSRSMAKRKELNSPEPPPGFDCPYLYLVDSIPEGGSTARAPRLARLYRTQPTGERRKQEWLVGISPAQGKTTVEVEGLNELSRELHAFWVSGDQVVNLRKSASVAVTAHDEHRYGYVVITPDAADLAAYTGRFALRGNYPNPFSRFTAIEFVVPYAWHADGSKRSGEFRNLSLAVYNAAGQQVRMLISGRTKVGQHRVVWDGRNSRGTDMPCGFYVARLTAGKHRKAIKMFRLR